MASFITTDVQLQLNRGCCFLVQAMLSEGFPFHQFIFNLSCWYFLTGYCSTQSYNSGPIVKKEDNYEIRLNACFLHWF